MKEAYCFFEVSKLLKEKGFPVKEIQLWYCEFDGRPDMNVVTDKQYPKITHQMAMAWLREEKNISIEIRHEFGNSNYIPWIVNTVDGDMINEKEADLCQLVFASYEEAVETALKYTLENLI